MTRTRLAVILLSSLGVVAGLTWIVAIPTRHHPSPAVAPPFSLPVLSAPSVPSVLAVPSAPSVPSAGGSVAVRAPAAPAPAPAEPFVQGFAAQPGVKPLKPVPSPTVTLKVAANIDGCDHAYGESTQCIPWTFPPGTADKCEWLAAHGFTGIKVVGTDRQKLDVDGDKIACNA